MIANGPNVVTDGLVLYLDAANLRSFPGEPTTNLIPFPNDFTTWIGNYYNNWLNSVVESNVELAPDGTMSASRLGDGYARFTPSITITPGATYSFSVWLKNITLTQTFYVRILWGLNGSYGRDDVYYIPISTISNWTRLTWTATASSSGANQVQFGIGPGSGYHNGQPSGAKLAVWNGQVEQKSHPTPFVNGTRGTTVATGGGWKDLSGNNNDGELVNDPVYNSDQLGSVQFDGVDDWISIPAYYSSQNITSRSWEVFIKSSSSQTEAGIFGTSYSIGCTYYCNGGITIWDGTYRFDWFDNAVYQFLDSGISPVINQYDHVVCTWDGSDSKPRIYVNGVLKATGTVSNLDYNAIINLAMIGRLGYAGYYFNGTCGLVKYYHNKCLTASEILQNYNSLKFRYLERIVTDGLVLHIDSSRQSSYPEPKTSIMILDLSPSGNNGTLVNGVGYDSVYGSLTFDGSNDEVTTDSHTISLVNGGTMEMWLMLTAKDRNQGFMVFNGGNSCVNFYMTSNNYMRWEVIGNFNLSFTQIFTTTVFTTSVWYHIIGTFDGTNTSIYVNGIRETTLVMTNQPLTITSSFIIGQYAGYAATKMASVRFYNKALTQTEVTQNFNADRSKFNI